MKKTFTMYTVTKILFLTLVCVSLFPGITQAAIVSAITDTKTVGVGGSFRTEVLLGSENESVNAIEGTITFPSNLVTLSQIEDGNSVVVFWVEKPEERQEGVVSFSGIIPGGYNQSSGSLFTLVFSAQEEGTGRVYPKAISIFKNDGTGTRAEAVAAPDDFTVSGISEEAQRGIEDTVPPEEFSVEITQDPSLFDNAWFLVFATQDKGVGIDRYEVCEGKTCIESNSPHLLSNQELSSRIKVIAIDKNGNERVSVVRAENNTVSIGILITILVALILYFIAKKRLKKNK